MTTPPTSRPIIAPSDPYAAPKQRLAQLLALDASLRAATPPLQKSCSLANFTQAAWKVLEPETPLVWGWYLDVICQHLEAVSDGTIRDLIINIPPRFSKSTIAAVMWPCWEWTWRPSQTFLFASYGAELAERDSLRCRRLLHSSWYQARYGRAFNIGGDRDLKDTTTKFENSKGGYRLATSVGGVTTGEGAGRLVCDDPLKAEDGNSEARRTVANRWWSETMSSRLNDQRTGSKIVIMQRLHEDDLTGFWLRANPDVQHLCFPMEYELPEDEQHHPLPPRVTVLGPYDRRTQIGELLCPERAGPAEVERLKRDTTEYGWAGQYQQRPAPRGGGMFRLDRLDTVSVIPPTARLLRCRAWDRAGTQGGGAYSAGARLAYDVDAHILYIEDMDRGQWATDVREAETLAVAQNDGRSIPVILEQEPGSAGIDSVKATARLLAGWRVYAIRATGSKEERATPLATQTAFGNVKLVRGPWNQTLLRELETFPRGRYRDQVDALSLGYNWLTAQTVPFRPPVTAPPPPRFQPR